MRVLKWTNRLDSPQPLLQSLDLTKDLVAGLLAVSLFLGNRQLGKLTLDFGSLGHVVEHTGKESTLLSSNLSSGGVVGDGAVTNSPDVLGTLDNEVLVYGKTTARIFLSGDLVDQVLDNGAESITGGPNKETVGNPLKLLLAIRASRLGLNVLVRYVLDHGLCADIDGLLLEGLLRIVDELLGEHGKDVGQRLDEGNLEVILDLGQPLLQIRVEEVLELSGKLDTSRTATDNNHVKQALLLLLRLVLECSRLAAIHDTVSDALSIANLLQEKTVLLDTGDT